jgi:hypothetical protein
MMAVEEDFPFSHFANKCQNPENTKKCQKWFQSLNCCVCEICYQNVNCEV